MTPHHSPRRRLLWLCVVVAVVGFIAGIGGSVLAPRRAMETHEIFVAQTARQMLAADEWVLPSFNDKLRLNKPPLMYWAVMGVKLASGAPDVLPWTARLPSAVASAMMALATVWLGRSLVNASVGVLAAIIGCGSIGWVAYANNARPEMLYAACCAVMVACFAATWRRAATAETPRKQQGGGKVTWIALCGWLAGGLAILTKGPQLPVVLLLGFVAFAIAEGKTHRLLALRPLIGLPLMLLVPVPWAIAVLARAPGGWRAWTNDLFAGRAGEPDVSVWDWLNPYYLYGIPGLLAPWCVLLPLGIWWAVHGGKRTHAERWGGRLAVWLLVVPAVVMSLTIHRRDYYMLSLMPLMAVLVAAFVWSHLAGKLSSRRARAGLTALAVTVALAGFAAAAWPGAWSKRRERMNSFAQQTASVINSQIGPEAHVLVWATDEAFLVYARNRPTPEAASMDDLVDHLRGGPKYPTVDAVLTTKAAWPAVERAYLASCGEPLRSQALIEGGDGLQLIKIQH